MKKHKILKLAAFAFMFVLMLAGTMRMTASAEAIQQNNVMVDYSYETITVKTDKDSVIYFTDKYNKDLSRWEVCEVREINGENVAVFDISWITSSKTVRLYLCGDVQTDVISVDLTWEETMKVKFTGTLLTTDITEAETWKEKYKAYPNFSEDTGYFIFTIAENGRDMSYFELENIEWRKGDDGVWRPFDELDLKEMNIKGIKLEFRVTTDNEAKMRASSIGKVTVNKLSSAPDVSVNEDTMMVGVKNGQEFSFDKETWILIPSYNKKYGTENYLVDEETRETAISEISTSQRISGLLIQKLLDVPTNTPLYKANLQSELTGKNVTFTDEGIVLYVRTAGTTSKAASKISEIVIPYAVEKDADAIKAGIKLSHAESMAASGGIVAENVSNVKYQVGVITPEDAAYADVEADSDNVDISEIKWTSVKAGKLMKFAKKKVPEGSYLIYRVAGENGQLPSTYVIEGPIAYNVLTFAGISDSKKKNEGDVLEAVASTNLDTEEELKTLSYQWQRCANVKADNPVWEDIEKATEKTYTLTKEDGGYYIRVVITQTMDKNEVSKMVSDHIGPVKAKPEENPKE